MRSHLVLTTSLFALLTTLGCAPMSSMNESRQSSQAALDESFSTTQALTLSPASSAQDLIYAWPYQQTLIGTSHTAAQYDPNGLFNWNIMSRGAMDARILGFNSLKIWVDPNSPSGSNFRIKNPNVNAQTTLADLMNESEFKTTLSMPFKAFFLEVDAHIFAANLENRFLSDVELADVDSQIYQLTRRLIQDHAGTGRVFLIQNHEGDNHLADFGNARYAVKEPNVVPPTSVAYANFRKYFTTRQAAVRRARADAGPQNVAVYHVCEVNAVVRTYRPALLAGLRQQAEAVGQRLLTTSLTTEVLPFLDCDAYGYSAYDATHQDDVNVLGGAIEYIRQHTQPSAAFGRNNVMVTEFGIPENVSSAQNIIAYASRTQFWLRSLNIPAFVVWQMYDNECRVDQNCKPEFNGIPLNMDDDGHAMGFWMRKVSGGAGLLYQGMEPYLLNEVSDHEVGTWTYRLLLGREPTWDEAMGFQYRLRLEGGRHRFFMNAANSDEARRKLVNDVFQKLFGRGPDDMESNHWAESVRNRPLALAANDLIRQGQALILQVTPAPAPQAPPVVVPAPEVERSEADLAKRRVFVTSLYQVLYGRAADAAGLKFHSESRMNCVELSVEFARADEFKTIASGLNGAKLVSRLYEGLYRRYGDVDGVIFWAIKVDRGAMSRTQVIDAFLESPELVSSCAALDLK